MAIVATEVSSIHGSLGQQRLIFYRCQDSEGVWHSYGPIITIDDNFDVDGYKAVAADKVESSLVSSEISQALES